MFKKHKCKNCKSKSSTKFDFCPYCGHPLLNPQEMEKKYGLLGKNPNFEESKNQKNEFDEIEQMVSSMFGGGLGGKMISKMMNSTFKMMEKEFEKEMKNSINEEKTNKNQNNQQKNPMPNPNFQLFINGKKVNLNPTGQPLLVLQEKRVKQVPSNLLPQNSLKNYSKLKKEEPKTRIVRLSNNISYEMEMPGVKTESDISINRVESGYEIKAVSSENINNKELKDKDKDKDNVKNQKAYFKNLQISLPLIRYFFSDEKLTMEFSE